MEKIKNALSNTGFIVFIIILFGNILFGGNGITKKQVPPFFSWNLFSNVDPAYRSFSITLPEKQNRRLDDILIFNQEKEELRYAVKKCFNYSEKKIHCSPVYEESILGFAKKQEATYVYVMVSPPLQSFFTTKGGSQVDFKSIEDIPFEFFLKIDIK